jgi:hypothetical protein
MHKTSISLYYLTPILHRGRMAKNPINSITDKSIYLRRLYGHGMRMFCMIDLSQFIKGCFLSL